MIDTELVITLNALIARDTCNAHRIFGRVIDTVMQACLSLLTQGGVDEMHSRLLVG